MNTTFSKEKLEEIIQTHWESENKAGVKMKNNHLLVFAKTKPLFKGGRAGTITNTFELVNVPKDVAEKLITKKNVLREYKDWVDSLSNVEIDKAIHLGNLTDWVVKHKNEGFIIEWQVN
jgi:hypothetical protein